MAQPLRVDEFVDELRKYEKKEEFMAVMRSYEQRYFDMFEQQANSSYPPELQKQSLPAQKKEWAQQAFYNNTHPKPPIVQRSHSANKLDQAQEHAANQAQYYPLFQGPSPRKENGMKLDAFAPTSLNNDPFKQKAQLPMKQPYSQPQFLYSAQQFPVNQGQLPPFSTMQGQQPPMQQYAQHPHLPQNLILAPQLQYAQPPSPPHQQTNPFAQFQGPPQPQYNGNGPQPLQIFGQQDYQGYQNYNGFSGNKQQQQQMEAFLTDIRNQRLQKQTQQQYK